MQNGRCSFMGSDSHFYLIAGYGTWLVEQRVPECVVAQTQKLWNPQNIGRVRVQPLPSGSWVTPQRMQVTL